MSREASDETVIGGITAGTTRFGRGRRQQETLAEPSRKGLAVPWLADYRARRELAAPLPENRAPADEAVDPADPGGRAALVASGSGSCDLEGADAGELLAAASRVAEELRHDDPPATWQARACSARGHDPHDVIHLLAESASR